MGKVWIKVKPNAKRDSIELTQDGLLKISVTAPAVEGKANNSVCRILAEKLSLKKSEVKIVLGKTSNLKLVELPLDQEEIKNRLLNS